MSNIITNLPANKTLAQNILLSFEYASQHCTTPTVFFTAEPLPGMNVTFHEMAVILSSVPTILCCLISIYIITGHYLHWVNPKEQKQIVLCIAFLPIFCVLNFFAGWFYRASAIIVPVLSVYTAKGLIAVFLLYIGYISPEENDRGTFYVGLERRAYNGNRKHDKGSLRWFRVIWVLVFQIVPVTMMLFPISYIIVNVICPLDSRLESAEMAMAGLQFLTTSTCWTAIFLYYKRTQSQLKNYRGSRKLNSFQSLVGLQSIQSLVFPLLTQTASYLPTKYISYEDFTNVIPAFMTCWESLIFSILFIKVFSFTPYRNAVLVQHEHPETVGRAVMDTINQMDIVRGVIYMFQILFQRADDADFCMAREEYGSANGSENGSENGASYELEPVHNQSVAMDEILQNLNSHTS
ncbi:hypothetical protein V502_09349 [Pseudogymnoascus sp. VKM F-4520 (FW-2644)]|nr:hypothetical protein V502_09349 [Pseudogymnoascus sp. VKM F-4520 (FW-2644)]